MRTRHPGDVVAYSPGGKLVTQAPLPQASTNSREAVMTCEEQLAQANERIKVLEDAIRQEVEVSDLTWEYVDELEIPDVEAKEVLLSMVTVPGLKDVLGIPR